MRQAPPPAETERETAPRRSYADLIRIAIAVADRGRDRRPADLAVAQYGGDLRHADGAVGRGGEGQPPADLEAQDLRPHRAGRQAEPAAIRARRRRHRGPARGALRGGSERSRWQARGRLRDLAHRHHIARHRQGARACDTRRYRNSRAQDQHDLARCAAKPTPAALPATPSRSYSSCRRTFPPAASSAFPESG